MRASAPPAVCARRSSTAGGRGAKARDRLTGERTVTAARGAFEFDDPTTIEAKGKPGGVACGRLVRALSLMRPRGVRGLKQAFVGRESELGLLQATYHRVVSEGRPHLVTVMGDSGVGKTRLLRELWAGSAQSRRSRCAGPAVGNTVLLVWLRS